VPRYYFVMIVSFRDPDAQRLAGGQRVRRFVSIEAVLRRKLRQLEIAGRLEDLRIPPGQPAGGPQGGPRRTAQYPSE
jgi:proteic killer suppression protein